MDNNQENFIYRLPNNGVGNSSGGGQYNSDNQNTPLTIDDVNGLISQQLRTQTERQVMVNGSNQSQNFVTGASGWQIDAEGNAEFNDGTFRGTFILGGVIITINDITKLAAAITTVSNAGGGIIALEPGTYSPTATITIPSNVTLNGNGATIDFGNTAHQILIQGTNAYTTGTLSVNFGSTTVTGVGTTWTAGMVGQSILIGDFWYTIASRASNTSITISSPMLGTSLSGDTYVIATTVNNTGIENLTVQNSTASLVKGVYCNVCNITGVTTISGNVGFDFTNSQSVNLPSFGIDSCTTALIFNNVPYGTIGSSAILSSGVMSLTRVTNTGMSVLSFQASTGVALSFTNCSNIGLVNYSIIETTSHGIEFVSGNSDIDFVSGYINTCGGDGIKLTASSNRIQISNHSIINNTGYGINIANSNDNNAVIIGNDLNNNTAGNLHDLGTGTKIRGNQGVSDNIVEGDLSLTDITTNNVSSSKHGFAPKFPNNTTTFLRGDGTYAAPASGSPSSTSDVSSFPTSSSTQTITHSLGKTPSVIRLTGLGVPFGSVSSTFYSFSSGTWNSTGNRSVYIPSVNQGTNGAPTTSTSFAIYGDVGANGGPTITGSGVVGNVTSTTFDIVWTTAGNPSPCKFIWETEG